MLVRQYSLAWLPPPFCTLFHVSMIHPADTTLHPEMTYASHPVKVLAQSYVCSMQCLPFAIRNVAFFAHAGQLQCPPEGVSSQCCLRCHSSGPPALEQSGCEGNRRIRRSRLQQLGHTAPHSRLMGGPGIGRSRAEIGFGCDSKKRLDYVLG